MRKADIETSERLFLSRQNVSLLGNLNVGEVKKVWLKVASKPFAKCSSKYCFPIKEKSSLIHSFLSSLNTFSLSIHLLLNGPILLRVFIFRSVYHSLSLIFGFLSNSFFIFSFILSLSLTFSLNSYLFLFQILI